MTDRSTDLSGYIVGNGDRTKWRAWRDGLPVWVDDPAEATRYSFRSDANAVHAEDEDAWCIVEYKDVATPYARITGDKGGENPAPSAVADELVSAWNEDIAPACLSPLPHIVEARKGAMVRLWERITALRAERGDGAQSERDGEGPAFDCAGYYPEPAAAIKQEGQSDD